MLLMIATERNFYAIPYLPNLLYSWAAAFPIVAMHRKPVH